MQDPIDIEELMRKEADALRKNHRLQSIIKSLQEHQRKNGLPLPPIPDTLEPSEYVTDDPVEEPAPEEVYQPEDIEPPEKFIKYGAEESTKLNDLQFEVNALEKDNERKKHIIETQQERLALFAQNVKELVQEVEKEKAKVAKLSKAYKDLESHIDSWKGVKGIIDGDV